MKSLTRSTFRVLFILGSLALIACGQNKDDQQVIPVNPGIPVYNCVPGQACAYGPNVLTNNLSAPLIFSGAISLNRSKSDRVMKDVRSLERQANTGYSWSFCLGCGGHSDSSVGFIQITANQTQGPATFQIVMTLGTSDLYDSQSPYPAGATIRAVSSLFNTNNGNGSQLQFRDVNFPGLKFNVVSSNARLDGSSQSANVQIILNDDYTQPFGTATLTTIPTNSFPTFGY